MSRLLAAFLVASALIVSAGLEAAAAPRDTVENQMDAAPEWIERDRKAAVRGDLDAQYRLAGAYNYGKGVPENHAEAAKWYRLAAEVGHVRAQFKLGNLYHYGEGVPLDDEVAAEWLELAAESGHATAQLFVSALYRFGRGVPLDLVRSYLWAEQAASNGEFIGVSFMRLAAVGMTDAQRTETESRAKYRLLPYE
jgi:TPR repeat protein